MADMVPNENYMSVTLDLGSLGHIAHPQAEFPWGNFGRALSKSGNEIQRDLKDVYESLQIETRLRLTASRFLSKEDPGVVPNDEVLALEVQLSISGNMQTILLFEDGTARHLSSSGVLIIQDDTSPLLKKTIAETLLIATHELPRLKEVYGNSTGEVRFSFSTLREDTAISLSLDRIDGDLALMKFLGDATRVLAHLINSSLRLQHIPEARTLKIET